MFNLLPYNEKPLSVMYHYIAFPLGIVQAKMDEKVFEFWLATKYINCSFSKKLDMNMFNIGEDLWFTEERILLRHHNAISRIIYDNYQMDVVTLLKKVIDMGYYPQGNYNEEWIPLKTAYKKYRFYHDYLLVGYDESSQVFYSVGFLSDNRFQKYEISFDNMRKAIETLFDNNVSFDFLEYHSKKVKSWKFDINVVVEQLNAYIASLPQDGKKQESEMSYGLNAIFDLSQYIEDCAQKYSYIELKYTRGLADHKFFMYKRIQFLYKNKYISDPLFCQNSKMIYQMAEKVHLLAMKFSIKQDIKIIISIKNLIDEMIKLERDYLVDVIKSIYHNLKKI